MLYCFDSRYQLRDIYFPHIGMESHCNGSVSRLGVWLDGVFSWAGDDGWTKTLGYEPGTLVTAVHLQHRAMEVEIEIHECIDFHERIYVRQIDVTGTGSSERALRLFIHHDLHMGGNDIGDTAYFDPGATAMVHYKDNFYLLCSGMAADHKGTAATARLDGFAAGQAEMGGSEGTWKDAEDGQLSNNPVAQGSVDSVFQLNHTLLPGSAARFYTWDIAGSHIGEVHALNQLVCERGPSSLLSRTRTYWRLWGEKLPAGIDSLPAEVANLYTRSILTLRTQIDQEGGILAANDSDIIGFARDSYSYVWPRDGAITAAALLDAGYQNIALAFFRFCEGVIRKEGYFLHKYSPDGCLASSWHPWVRDGKPVLPIQEDETALVIWALERYFAKTHDVDGISPLYRNLVTTPASFMVGYRDKATGLPAPSWDLWEERWGVHAFTVATVYAGLLAAERLASAFGDRENARKYSDAAAEIQAAACKYLFRADLNRFARMLTVDDSGTVVADSTIDSSLSALWQYGLLPADDPRIASTMQAIRDRLLVKTKVGGYARYENDYYQQVSHDTANVPGNPWFVCTLWMGNYLAETADSQQGLSAAADMLSWVARRALPSGILAEQVHPYTDQPLSVSPLTWSHAEFVSSVHHYLKQSAVLAESLQDPAAAL